MFEFDELSGGNSLRYMGYELLRTQGLISKLRVSYELNTLFGREAGAGGCSSSDSNVSIYHSMAHCVAMRTPRKCRFRK